MAMRAIALAAFVIWAGPALAETGHVAGTVVVSRRGAPAPADGVIVYLTGFNEPAAEVSAEIRQRDRRFAPELVAITAGQSVTFPNGDPFFHNVFSASAARRFDLGQYPQGEAKSKQFPSVGVVDVFCNIHPEMAATILVLPNRRFARAAKGGSFHIEGVPPGHWTLYAYSRRAAGPVKTQVDVAAGQTAEVALSIVETRDAFPHPNKFGEKYRDPAQYRPR